MTDHDDDVRAFSGIALWGGIMLAVWAIVLTIGLTHHADPCRDRMAHAETAIDLAVAGSSTLPGGLSCAEVAR